MPVDEEGKVHFKSTLFSLIRINLQIFMRSMEEMDQADQELRAAIQKSWPSTRGGKIHRRSKLPESMGGKVPNRILTWKSSRQTHFLPVLVDTVTSRESWLGYKMPKFWRDLRNS